MRKFNVTENFFFCTVPFSMELNTARTNVAAKGDTTGTDQSSVDETNTMTSNADGSHHHGDLVRVSRFLGASKPGHV
jgi:hypothetical protein